MLYRVKKLCVEKINNYYDGNHKMQTGVDYNDLEKFEENWFIIYFLSLNK